MWLLYALLLFGGAAESVTPGRCSCAQALENGGWCDVHEIGFIGSVEVDSRLLFDALDAHGHTVDPATFDCPSCREAIATAGFCATHRIGFFEGKAYFSRLSYSLARGRRLVPAAVECPTCRRHMAARGWCATCGVGMVGNVAIHDRRDFDEVDRALSIVESANRVAARCEHCAMAMVTDTQCPVCGIRYEGGKEAGRVTPPRKVD